jgi:hypothetical protein
MKNTVFRDVTPRGSCKNRRFEGIVNVVSSSRFLFILLICSMSRITVTIFMPRF